MLLPKNGKFFKRWSATDQSRFQHAEMIWEETKESLPYPKCAIPRGAETSRLLEHHYNNWHEMFGPRQLLALSTLLDGIMAEESEIEKEMLLCAFSGVVESNNLFTRYRVSRNSAGGQTAEGLFGRHDYQLKITIAENNTFGLPNIAGGTLESQYTLLLEGVKYQQACWDFKESGDEDRKKVLTDKLTDVNRTLHCGNSAEVSSETPQFVVTDPPYVGNVNYAELADFFYVWLRLALKDRYHGLLLSTRRRPKRLLKIERAGKARRTSIQGSREYLNEFMTNYRQMV